MVVDHRLAVGLSFPRCRVSRSPSPSKFTSTTLKPDCSPKHLVQRISSELSLSIPGVAAENGTLTGPSRFSESLPVPVVSEVRIRIHVSSDLTCSEAGDIFLRVTLYAIDNIGKRVLVGYTSWTTSFSILKRRAQSHQLAHNQATKRPRLHHPLSKFLFAFAFSGLNLFHYRFRRTKLPRFLEHWKFSQRARSLFTFLRCTGPRCLPPSRRVILDQDGYQITHIGNGAFAVISRVSRRGSTQARVVMKRITFDESGLARYLAETEVDCLKAMTGNQWFPPLLTHFMDDEEFVISMPFYQRGDLAGLLEHRGYLGRSLAQFYAAQLVLAIEALHKQGIVHRDIKPDNILLDDAGHLLLADLGLAENLGTSDLQDGPAVVDMHRFPVWLEARAKGGDEFPMLWVDGHNPLGTRGAAGTYWYTAPEVFRNERYSFGVDYWSVGVIYHELTTGHIPFKHCKAYPENKRPVLDYTPKPGQVRFIKPWENRALDELLHPIPNKRPQRVVDIKRSPLFNGIDWESMSRREIQPPPLPLPLQED
ncbi:unnamed protein product [Cyclocybe aegerita]|uniref:non-specific serine/threonine protein kinase n=1 Tax=Cyclocybe aegerita TaxID=1973307 RepID=A0A8S0W6A0_CYCAE|nr:unnamed protein product [Cyclocybe aegerita]